MENEKGYYEAQRSDEDIKTDKEFNINCEKSNLNTEKHIYKFSENENPIHIINKYKNTEIIMDEDANIIKIDNNIKKSIEMKDDDEKYINRLLALKIFSYIIDKSETINENKGNNDAEIIKNNVVSLGIENIESLNGNCTTHKKLHKNVEKLYGQDTYKKIYGENKQIKYNDLLLYIILSIQSMHKKLSKRIDEINKENTSLEKLSFENIN